MADQKSEPNGAEILDGRQRISPRSDFERDIGYTRAMRVNDQIMVGGIIGVEEDGSVSDDAQAQAARCFTLIQSYIEELGGRMEDVVRVRMFATNIDDAEAISAAFSKALSHVRPTGTLVAIAGLYDPRLKVEIEADAIVGAIVTSTK